MPSITRKATIATVSIGNLGFEGLMLEDDGSFAIGVPQIGINWLNQDTQNYTAQTLKRLLAKGSKTPQVVFFDCKTEFNKNKTLAVNLIDFQRILRVLDKAGYQSATDTCDDLIGVAIDQLWADAFNIKREKEDRQRVIVARQTHRQQFRDMFTDWLKEDGDKLSITVNYGAEVNKLKTAAGLSLKHIDDYNPDDYALMEQLNRTYYSYHMLRSSGKNHDETIAVIESTSTK